MMRRVLALGSVALLAAAGDVGSEGFTVPPFKCFGEQPVLVYEMSSAVSDLSGITWNPSSSTLFAINNADRVVYEIEYPNTLIRSYDVKHLTLDLEGISSVGGREFAFTDENPSKVIRATLNTDGSVTNAQTLVSGVTPAAGMDLGFAGVTWLNGLSKYIAVQEAMPPKVWEVDTTTGPAQLLGLSGDLNNHALKIRSIGGLSRGGDSTSEVFIVAKVYNASGREAGSQYVQKGILRYRLSDGLVTERFGGEVCSMTQPEGMTFWKNATSGKIMMMVVGETYEARVYEADPACTDSIGSVSNLMQTCAEKKQVAWSCEKTMDDGGCPWRRCDKTVTPFNKICVDTQPGVTDCTEDECRVHCSNTTFGSMLNCTHYAYDKEVKECYLFSGCLNDRFDPDLTTYALYDPTCEKTREASPLGCVQRRCNKDLSMHAKVCTSLTPGVTDCTLDECEQQCRSHTAFTCTTYSYDPAGMECYLFETCEAEAYDKDFSTYVLVDPTCDKSREQGGCNQRICDTGLTPYMKACSPDGQICTMNECEMLCAQYTFADIDSEAFCTHWAYHATDKSCYLFSGCVGEKYDETYHLFTQSYGRRQELGITVPFWGSQNGHLLPGVIAENVTDVAIEPAFTNEPPVNRLCNVPTFLEGTTHYRMSHSVPEDTIFEFHCPTSVGACDVYVFHYHEPPCSAAYNGQFPALLIQDGWQPGSCAPRLCNSEDERWNTVMYRKQVLANTTVATPPLETSCMSYFGLFAGQGIICEENSLQDSTLCQNAITAGAMCKWTGSECVSDWCTKPAKNSNNNNNGNAGNSGNAGNTGNTQTTPVCTNIAGAECAV